VSTSLHRALSVLWFSLTLALAAVVGLNLFAPVLGYRLVIVTGPSMTPAIPLGAVVIERAPDTTLPVVGDVVTVRLPNGVAITHRVIRIGDGTGGQYLETRGDANAGPDPTVIPAASVTGIVDVAIPVVGYALAFLAMPTGVLSVILLLAALLTAIWSLEELDAVREPRPGTVHEATDGIPA
jgi:signal peptidase